MTTRTRSPISLLAVGGTALLLVAAVWGWRSLLGSEEAPPCQLAGPVLADAIDDADLDLAGLIGNQPSNSITELRGQQPDKYPEAVCEKLFIGAAEPIAAVDNLAIHRYPSSEDARSGFPSFFQQSIDYGAELAPGHRYDPEDRKRSAHLAPGSCLIITITWQVDNPWEPEQRHAAVMETVSPLAAAVCPEPTT